MPSEEDQTQQHVQGQLLPPTSHQGLLSLEDLEWSLGPNWDMEGGVNWGPEDTMENSQRHHHPDTTRLFPSIPQRSPSLNRPQTPHHPTLGSDPSREQMGQMMAGTTTTGASHDLSLEDSPSWSSAMTHMQMQELGHFYPHHREEAQIRVQLPHPDSSHPHQPSPSSIGIHTPQQQQQQALHYSQELHRQQQEQLRQLQHPDAHQSPEEEDYLQHLAAAAAAYHHQQQQQYFHLTEDPTHHPHYPTHQAHDHHHGLPSSPLVDPQSGHYTQALLPPQHQMHRFLAEAEAGTPNSMIKFESPSLHTPPLLLE
jgi:hypothetical protein